MYFPSKLEEFSIPARRLTDKELDYWAWRTARTAQSVYEEDPGVWPNFQMYLGFRIGVESLSYVWHGDNPREEMERFAKAVMKHAFGEPAAVAG